jgi:hypothetical protein
LDKAKVLAKLTTLRRLRSAGQTEAHDHHCPGRCFDQTRSRRKPGLALNES